MPPVPSFGLFPRFRRTVAGLGVAAALSVPALLPGLAPAAAAAGPSLQGDAAVRLCVDTAVPGCAPVGTLPHRSEVTMVCWVDGSWETGKYATDRWFFVAAGATRGFVHASWVIDQATVGHCPADRAVASVRWAAEHVDRTAPTPEEAAVLGIDDGMWSGWCAALTYGAYHFGAGATPAVADNAAPRFRAYERAGKVRPWAGADAVPVGAMVFWPDVAAPYGHTALFVGDGHVVSTMGFGDPTRPVSRVAVDTWGAPRGWVAPQDV